MVGWILAGVFAVGGLARALWRYPEPALPPRVLSRRELALIDAAAEATFPPGGLLEPSGAEAGIAAYTDRWLEAVQPRMRRLMRLLFFLVEHATLLFPAPGRRGFRRFSSLDLGQRQAVLEGWRTSRLFPRRVVFASLRAILAMGYFAHPPVLRQLRVAPLAIDVPVCEADLLYPPVGRGPEAIAYTRADLRASSGEPLDLDGPLHPDYAERTG